MGGGGWSVIRQQPWRARQSVKVCMDTGTSSQVSDLLSAVLFFSQHFRNTYNQLFSLFIYYYVKETELDSLPGLTHVTFPNM